MNILYTSISGNTRAFAKHIQELSQAKHQESTDYPIIQVKEIHDNSPLEIENEPFFAIVPTYLEGGNGIDNGDQEILTESLRDYIAFDTNAQRCLGVIGGGNKNFGYQYCLTAQQYAQQFNIPFLADFELRGNPVETEQIYTLLCKCWQETQTH